jgi:hypothetical protein
MAVEQQPLGFPTSVQRGEADPEGALGPRGAAVAGAELLHAEPERLAQERLAFAWPAVVGEDGAEAEQ